jgi:hypothetical protein
VQSVGDKRLVHHGRRAMAGEPQPQLPIRGVMQAAVEPADERECVAADDNRRTTARNDVPVRQEPDNVLGGRWRVAPHHAQARRDVHVAGAGPGPIGDGCGPQLPRQLVWAPQVVVVAEAHPLPPSLGNPPVTGRTNPPRKVMTHQANPRIPQPSHHRRSVVAGAIVDHDHLQVDVLLPQDATQGQRQQPAAVVGGNNHRDLRRHHPRSCQRPAMRVPGRTGGRECWWCCCRSGGPAQCRRHHLPRTGGRPTLEPSPQRRALHPS